MFVERGFDAVTVAQVAQAAGVSSVTVFKHFPRKEDLFLDRSDETIALFRSAVAGRPLGDALTALESLTTRLVDERAPVSGLAPGSEAFFRTIAGSSALQARARELAADAQAALAEATGDELLAAFFVAGYATVFVGTARRIIADEDRDAVAVTHRAGLRRLFDGLRDGVAPVT
jgi:AcrR family transcriptional regulator